MTMSRVTCAEVQGVEVSVTDGTVANMIRLHSFDAPRIAPRMGRGIEYNGYSTVGCSFWSRDPAKRLKVVSIGIAGQTRGGSLRLGDVYEEGTSGHVLLTAEETSLSLYCSCANDLHSLHWCANSSAVPPAPLPGHMYGYLGRESERVNWEMKNGKCVNFRILGLGNQDLWRMERK